MGRILNSFRKVKSCQSKHTSQPLVVLGCGWGRALVHGSWVSGSAPQLSLEEPIETAVLLSLAGVNSILANQWPALLRDNALRASVLWESEWVWPQVRCSEAHGAYTAA